jgi:SEL1 protein
MTQTNRFPKTKLTVVAVLLSVAIAIAAGCFTLQLKIDQERQDIEMNASGDKSTTTTKQPSTEKYPKQEHQTIQSSRSTADIFSLQESEYPPPHGSSHKTIGEAYWKMTEGKLYEWDSLLQETEHSQFYHNRNVLFSDKVENPRFALQQAAHAGHPVAQYYMGNALASGIWPFLDEEDEDFHSDLKVLDEWLPEGPDEHPQITSSFLHWHMAAMAGNVEAAMALAYRRESLSTTGVCDKTSLLYLEAAAHGIIDQLEASMHSRAKVLPPMDKHSLAQVHMHGGTSSQLDYHNKPDESKEAIQFYHLKATTQPWSYSDDSKSSKKKQTIDVQAASTLGHLYHYGVRGVPQNLTLSLQYYEIAALNNHWKSAGHAGTFHLWGMGTEPNPTEAFDYFKLGAPGSFVTCFRRREQALLKKTGRNKDYDGESIYECDAQSLNGIGLIYLLGIPGKVEIDYQMAEQFFSLAIESGNADAHYNLAMMYLGWKTQYTNIATIGEGFQHDVANQGEMSRPLEAPTESEKLKFNLFHSVRIPEKQYRGPSSQNIKAAVKLLLKASEEGHLQAIHRLGMIYSEGIQIKTPALETFTLIKSDCAKAKKYYQLIVNRASVQRSKRLRKAYSSYINGDLSTSLLNYLTAAEAGSDVGQVNAAFLLEKGVCLTLSSENCAKASVRLWKAAAENGNAEASLRVGDFYYYGRLRSSMMRSVGPFGWMQFILYPEIYILSKLKEWKLQVEAAVVQYQQFGELSWPSSAKESEPEKQCTEDNRDETYTTSSATEENEWVDNDLSMAALYYTIAGDKYSSARAHFNLGFMHEWGIGVQQDFPLAKRHYDLAMSDPSGEAQVAVSVALFTMARHEYILKLQNAWNRWWNINNEQEETNNEEKAYPPPHKPVLVRQRVMAQNQYNHQSVKIRKWDVIQSHLLDHSTLLICVLVFCLLQLIEMRGRRNGRQPR